MSPRLSFSDAELLLVGSDVGVTTQHSLKHELLAIFADIAAVLAYVLNRRTL